MFASTAEPAALSTETKINVENLDVYYGAFHAIQKRLAATCPANRVMALIGPSGCGKSTFIRALNRMHDLTPGARVEGRVLLDDHDIYAPEIDPVTIRYRIGMVFQRPNPFPKVDFRQRRLRAAHPRRAQRGGRLMEICERSLRQAALWDEVKDRLDRSALALSGGQQQRLCIARCLAVDPEVILMDEPASALDPIATEQDRRSHRASSRKQYTVVIVTHSMQQAARISDNTAFFLLGELVETDTTATIFTKPKDKRTEDYITGRFG